MIPAEPLRLARLPGRRRGQRHLLLLPLAACAGVAWFGITGSLPVLIWWWHSRPQPRRGYWVIDTADLRAVRFGLWRTCVRGSRGWQEIFHDEVTPAELALLRRRLALALSARRGLEDVEPV